MNSANLILTEPIMPPSQLDNIRTSGIDNASDEKKKQIAKDFESVLLNKLFDEMKNTVGDWDSEEDGASEQIQGIFWLHLARDVADNGGLGLWEDIYKFIKDSGQTRITGKSLDGNA
jgi:Rod binding domain-containing protein